ncbi:hypothetical protein BTVI_11448 [Pitangus sulphuratus]|nr:hypothetical protein BTVI_11448 [Pitangus sulphuratus]
MARDVHFSRAPPLLLWDPLSDTVIVKTTAHRKCSSPEVFFTIHADGHLSHEITVLSTGMKIPVGSKVSFQETRRNLTVSGILMNVTTHVEAQAFLNFHSLNYRLILLIPQGPVAIVGIEVRNNELLFKEGTEELQNSNSEKDTKAITEAAEK